MILVRKDGGGWKKLMGKEGRWICCKSESENGKALDVVSKPRLREWALVFIG